ncbi:MAG: Phage head-tail joining protein [Planctomycetota bacterium]
MPMPTGLKNKLVQVERLRDRPTRLGERKSTADAWAPLGDPVWGNVKSVAASETTQEGRVQSTVIYTVVVSSYVDVRAADRLRVDGRVLAIQGIQPRGLRDEEWQITCTEEVQ